MATKIKEKDITLADNTTNNVSTAAHGFTPKLSNVATQYLDGTGLYSVPAGSGTSVGMSITIKELNYNL